MRQRLVGLWVGASLLAGCAGAPPKPVLYPNSHLQTVGQVQADRDIAECRQLALSSGVAEKKSGEVGKQAAETSPVFKNFVQRCLRERGYEVIGWQ